MRVLVTGARGFVGKEVVKTLKRKGFEVYGVDITPITPIIGDGFFLDIRNKDDVYNFMRTWQPDIVVHLAALVAGKPSLKSPYEYYRTNILGTLNVLDAMKEKGIKRLVYISSWSAFGRPEELPITEATPLNPENPYGVSKKCCEELVKSYAKIHGIKSIILRPTMIYGPNQPEKNVIQQVVDCMISGGKFEIYGTGEHTRECLYVTDVAEVVVKAIGFIGELGCGIFGLPYEIFVIGTEKPYMIKEIVKIGQSINYFPVEFKDVPTWAFSQSSSISKAKMFLHWKPKIDLKRGLKNILRSRK